MMFRHALSDAEWYRLVPPLPARRTAGTPYKDHRLILDGMLYRLATGCAWRDLPERYAPGARGEKAAGEAAAPGEPADHALGRSRGGFTTKLHLVADAAGLPLAVILSAGQAHESKHVEPVLNAVRVPRCGGGRRRSRPRTLVGDKGYSYPHIRRWLRRHHVRAVIPERNDQRKQRAHRRGRKPSSDRAVYRRRHIIENCVGWLREARGVATRYEKLAIHYLGVLKLAISPACTSTRRPTWRLGRGSAAAHLVTP